MIEVSLKEQVANPSSTLRCNICQQPEELVRDHNHTTGFIRALLCRQCNSYLGLYERNKLTKKKHHQWVGKYYQRIEYHLTCNTGIQMKKSKKKMNWIILMHKSFQKAFEQHPVNAGLEQCP